MGEQQQQATYSVLLVGLVGDTADVSTSFLGTLLRLQQKIATSKDVSVEFQFFENIKDAIAYFEMKSSFDRLVLMDSGMGIEADWILKKHPEEMDEVVAAYPKRELNWDAVASARQDGITDPNTLRRASYVYNFTPASKECQHQHYIRASLAQAKIVSVSRSGVAHLLERVCPWTRVLHDTVVDISTKAVNAGPYDFVGCVGTRLLNKTDTQQSIP